MNYKNLLLVFALAFLSQSCDDDSECCPAPEQEAQFESGIIVLNEGNFGSANASVSFINSEDQLNLSGIFNDVNGYSLGDTAQSIELHENLAMIVVNVSNKIEIVNRYTFESLGAITTNLSNPRFAEIIGNKIYVTNWGDGTNPDDDFVAVFNLADFSFDESINVAEGPEKMIAHNTSIYVAHKGGFSFNNLISLIDSQVNSVVKEIEVGDLPNSMTINGNDLWVLAAGKPSYADVETAGELSRIDLGTNEVAESFQFPDKTIHPANLNLVGNSAYMTIGKSLYKYEPGNALPVTEEYSFEEVAFLYGFAIHENKVYVASPRADFTGNGNLYIYDLNDGSLLDQFNTGINPNGVYFN
ncbi:YncE family protein [Christiangramia sabulilitoris]|uniref:YncE family protein n=1 Tax=Christiangramia sabulilitoris TaxID=2583991 RepID=A0A550I6Q9_9FLAO|nr:DUF5074 domain-containing protein [Christiangramia sabulilitoris]TRO66653.1 hypothetical protein FGM01_01850 [Christiangramia sabulilitoris]